MKFEPELIEGEIDDKRYVAQIFHLTRYAVGAIHIWRASMGEPFLLRVRGAFAERDDAVAAIEARVRSFAPRALR